MSSLENTPQALTDLELGEGLAGVFRGLADVKRREQEKRRYKIFLKVINFLAIISILVLPVRLHAIIFLEGVASTVISILTGCSAAVLVAWLLVQLLFFGPKWIDKILARK